MNLYLIERPDDVGWDEFDSAVVAAENEEEARLIHPNSVWDWRNGEWDGKEERYGTWVDADKVIVKYLGVADESVAVKVVCASFNAG